MIIGKLLATAGINNTIEQNPFFNKFVLHALGRHKNHDWGDCCEEDKITNDEALKINARIMSVYKVPKLIMKGDKKIWIITEADRSATTVLFPEEY